MYMAGGGDVNDNVLLIGDVWWSYTKGATWVLLTQSPVSNIYGNTAFYAGGHDYCLTIQYTANAASPSGYHKTLIPYGGGTGGGLGVSYQTSSQAQCLFSTSYGNVAYGELVFPSETTPASRATLMGAAGTANTNPIPVAAANTPLNVLSLRWYPACAWGHIIFI
jgi:hypothetical protein